MKQKRKSTKTVRKYPFQFFERKNTKSKFESPYSDQLQTAVKGTNHAITTADNRTIHRKLISKSITPFEQEPSNRGTETRGPGGQFARKGDKTPTTPDRSLHKKIKWTPAQNCRASESMEHLAGENQN